MSNAWFKHGLCAALGVALAASPAAAGPGPAGARRHTISLFAGFLGRQNANRWDCGLDNAGHVCVDPNGSTTVGGGYWPRGTPDQYVFGSGLQVSGIVDPSIGKTQFRWSGDTSAAFFEDPSGTHENGQQLSLIWNSNNPSDLLNWPRDAYVRDASLFDPGLIGLKVQDTWQRYWDGNPENNAGRPHALGILVDQRGMAWNFPSGNEDIIYFIYTFINITAKDPAVYAGRPDADSLASLGARFQALNEAASGVAIPDAGYKIVNAYAAFAADMDVSAQAKQNFTTAFIPFSMGIAFKSNWFAPEFIYPSTIFVPPFAPTVGEVGVKYLKSPVNPATGQEIGLTMFSATVNSGAFGDAANAAQVYRYHSATLSSTLGDAPCNYPGVPLQTHVCYIATTPDDIRFFQSSGPFTLDPGKSFTIVVAYIAAAPVDNAVLRLRSSSYTFPVGGPFPAQPAALAAGTDTLRTVDRIFGATSLVGDTGGAPGGGPNGKIDQNEVNVVPRSLLGKGLTAQAVFDAKFLLPFPPEPPDYYLVPGNNQVTVVWRPSPSENIPDPYYPVAHNNPASKLYDPNYRPLDVEGYRVYRGRTASDLTVIAQFDKAGTEYVDYTAELNYGNCAPELGVTTDCPADLATGHHVPIVGPFIQIPPGGRVELAQGPNATGNILILAADTAASAAGGTPNPFSLQDTGVPFAYVDHGVKNGFTYVYTVAAIDVNSVKSTGVGFSALEGRAPTKTVVPRTPSGQEAGGGGTVTVLSPGGTPLNAGAALPTIDKATGIFSGPMPPTDGLGAGFALDVGQLITSATVDMQIDSIVPGNGDPDGLGTLASTIYFITLQRAAPQTAIQLQVPVDVEATDVTVSGQVFAPLVARADNAKTARFKGGDTATFSLSAGATVSAPGTWRLTSFGRSSINEDPADAAFNGPRWWTGAANENTPNPNDSVCAPSRGACVKGNMTLLGNGDHNAGSLPGVSIFHLQSYSTIRSTPYRDMEAILSTVVRAADFQVYWGATANGSTAIDSVIDVTHKAPVPFKPLVRASWGILDDSSFTGLNAALTMDLNNGLLTWTDVGCVDPAPSAFVSFNTGDFVCSVSAPLRNRVHLSPIAMVSASDIGTRGLAATGTGFIVYLNGHYFLMQAAALPAAGTVWNARFYAGNITGSAGSYAFVPADVRPPAVPGLRAKGQFSGTTFDSTTTTAEALNRIHTVPDPYYVTNAFENSPNSKVIKFVNLPSECIIRIYSLSGVLVQALTFHDPTGGGEAEWNLRNRNNQFVASGVYFYHIEAPDGKSKIGRFTIVNFAQ